TGNLGDLIMGNWWDDSDQVAGLLRRGRIGAALQQSLEWSKLRRVPIWWVLGKAFLTSLPPTVTRGRYPTLTDGSYAPRTSEDSLEPNFRTRIGSEKQASLAA